MRVLTALKTFRPINTKNRKIAVAKYKYLGIKLYLTLTINQFIIKAL